MTTVTKPAAGPAAPYTEHDLDGFRASQRLAYACAETVAGHMTPGITEKQVVALLTDYCTARGVDEWFHKPYAWFGERAAFQDFRIDTQFFPTDRELKEGEPFILDVAPCLNGYASDIGYTHVAGENELVDQMRYDLVDYRNFILAAVNDGREMKDIYDELSRKIASDGYENRHARYPQGVLAHHIGRIDSPGFSALSKRLDKGTVARFGIPSFRYLVANIAKSYRGGMSPIWNGSRISKAVPAQGLWAVEPHIGFNGVGAKFEELLVVADGDAYWLDDDLPHVNFVAENPRV